MQPLKKIPFFLFLLPVFFCLHGSVENYGYLNPEEVLWLGLQIEAGIALFFGIILFFSRNLLFSSLVVFFTSAWYLFFGAIQDWIKSTGPLNFLRSYSILVPVLVIATLLWILWIKRKKKLQPVLVYYFNILLLLFCIADGVMLLNKQQNAVRTKTVKNSGFDLSGVKQKPNVYFLLFDEYAGYKSLKDSFAFANDSLYEFLRRKDFRVLPLHSNYDYTPFSMSSIFNMRYVDSNYDHRLLTQADIQRRFGEIRNAEVFSLFKNMGYELENYSIFDISEHPALSGSNPIFPIHSVLLSNKIFHNRFMKDLGWIFMSGRFELSFIRNHYLYRGDNFNKKAEEKVISSAKSKGSSPRFCYGHFFLPHGAYYRDSAGNYNSPSQMQDLFNKPLYLSYLKYTNTVIRSLVNNIVSADPGAVVVVMSDHGFYNYLSPGDDDPYNYDGFCHVRFPDKNYLPDEDVRSNVNFFRYLFNCEFGQKLPYLKDSTVFVNE